MIGAASAGPHHLRYRNTHRPDIGVYLANVLVPASDRLAVPGSGGTSISASSLSTSFCGRARKQVAVLVAIRRRRRAGCGDGAVVPARDAEVIAAVTDATARPR